MSLYFQSQLGIIKIDSENSEIVSIKFSDTISSDNNVTSVEKECMHQLEEYLFRKRSVFNLKIKLKGTEFQQSVWNELMNISYGETCSYKQVAERIGKPNAVRAVANAIGANPLAIVVPCHRVIGSNGKLTGYRYGLEIKKQLLLIEDFYIEKSQLNNTIDYK